MEFVVLSVTPFVLVISAALGSKGYFEELEVLVCKTDE